MTVQTVVRALALAVILGCMLYSHSLALRAQNHLTELGRSQHDLFRTMNPLFSRKEFFEPEGQRLMNRGILFGIALPILAFVMIVISSVWSSFRWF